MSNKNQYTEPVKISVGEQKYEWTPADGLLAYKDDFAANANQQFIKLFMLDLFAQYGEKFPATPQGPFLPTTTDDLKTTIYILNTFFADEEITVEGEAPTMNSLGIEPLKLDDATVIN